MESELWPVLEDLEDSIDGLSTTLKPLLEQHLTKNISTLPLLDKAKLFVLTTYAIESLLFSYLDLNGVDVKDHAIMKELTRVRQYFTKIRNIEAKDVEKKRDNLTLDKAAAGRFINSALSGNEKYDQERAEQLKLQKERAHIKFNALGEPIKPEPEQRRAEEEDDSSDEEFGGVRLVSGDSGEEEEGMDVDTDETFDKNGRIRETATKTGKQQIAAHPKKVENVEKKRASHTSRR